ncbi:MAG: methylamine utilization protein [Proteobacteria bacterium]|nr:methylamine utilization protein [Pseudomonadota bacterium]
MLAPLAAGLLAGTALAGDLEVAVLDRAGQGVAEVVITATPAEPGAPRPRPAAVATVDQRQRAFVPRVLAVAVGTRIEFPNSDSVSHQVYSFSPARRFQLPLYKGSPHPPVEFDREGLVVLGCNIHDEMVGYVYVTRAPYFATTGEDGRVRFHDLPAGGYRVVAWGPRVADPPASLVRELSVAAHEPASLTLRLARELRARPEPRPRDPDWEY